MSWLSSYSKTLHVVQVDEYHRLLRVEDTKINSIKLLEPI
jgi:succinate dehydrogenase flavin-adding protein (antitoxin of CptAB toxin-antitoxin module)